MGERITLKVDGRDVEVDAGSTVLDAARELDIEVPVLCHDDRVDPAGCCRMCLVEIDGQRRLQPGCAWKATPGHVRHHGVRPDRHVTVEGAAVDVRWPISSATIDGTPKQKGVGNELRAHVESYGTGPDVSRRPIAAAPSSKRLEVPAPTFGFDADTCMVSVPLCTRYCDEVEAVSAITLAGPRRVDTTIATADQSRRCSTPPVSSAAAVWPSARPGP